MADNQWGGEWTDEKLRVLRGYLEAYLTALKNQPFRLGYIDAFAGAGYRLVGKPGDENQRSLLGDAPVQAYRRGSARVALDLDPGFDGYIFIERNGAKVEELQALSDGYKNKQVRVHRGDANERIQTLCRLDWRGRRAVVFLDPYGMQVEWATLEALAQTEAVDVWLLFPVAVAVNRLLTRQLKDIGQGWQRRLDLTFGTSEWRSRLYESPTERARRLGTPPSLFDVPSGSNERRTKAVGLDDIAAYYIERLGTLFPFVAQQHRLLKHPNGQPLYALVFAAANPNPKAGGASLRIAGHLLRS